MPSAAELKNGSAAARKTRRRALGDTLESWNRKSHYYLGLYFLFFLWLFSFTGLLLNHPAWSFAEFWPQRKEMTETKRIVPPAGSSDLARARSVMRELGLSGEIEWLKPRQDPGRFDFRVSRPGRITEVRTDLNSREATVKTIVLNGWGVIHILHTFTGVHRDDPMARRDWMLTSLWSFSMDALSAGLLWMVLSGYYMWYRQEGKRRLGWVATAAGLLSCGFFVYGLVWIAMLR